MFHARENFIQTVVCINFYTSLQLFRFLSCLSLISDKYEKGLIPSGPDVDDDGKRCLCLTISTLFLPHSRFWLLLTIRSFIVSL